MRKVNVSDSALHLMPHDQIFIIQLIIRTIIKCSREETHHVVLVKIHIAHIALILIIINKIYAGITI